MVSQPGFFDLSDRYAALSAAGDPLERLASVVDFEVFRGPLIAALRRSARGKGGRPPFDPVMMFKILVLQALYSLSDEATEFQIKDRLSFQRFLGLGLDGRVPASRSAWLTSPITSSVSHGSKGEVRLHSAKTGCQAALPPRKQRKPGPRRRPSTPKNRDQTPRAAVRPKIEVLRGVQFGQLMSDKSTLSVPKNCTYTSKEGNMSEDNSPIRIDPPHASFGPYSRDGQNLYISGQLPFAPDGSLVK